jgi:hypothetical protein
MPQFANFSLRVVEEIFAANGIYPIIKFPDGQIMWGDRPMNGNGKYEGKFQMADCYTPGRYDIFTIRSIIEGLEKIGALEQIEAHLYDHIFEK